MSFYLMASRAVEVLRVVVAIFAIGVICVLMGWMGWSSLKILKFQFYRDLPDARVEETRTQELAKRTALDAATGFVRIDQGTSEVAIYRDAKTGCEWFSVRGGQPQPRTAAPDKNGVRGQICSPGNDAAIPAVQ